MSALRQQQGDVIQGIDTGKETADIIFLHLNNIFSKNNDILVCVLTFTSTSVDNKSKITSIVLYLVEYIQRQLHKHIIITTSGVFQKTMTFHHGAEAKNFLQKSFCSASVWLIFIRREQEYQHGRCTTLFCCNLTNLC